MNSDGRVRHGRYQVATVGRETVRTFIPSALPPDPPLRLDPLLGLLEEANRAIGRLDGVAYVLPAPPLFLYSYVRKEALLSSQIEGTQSSFSDLLLFENEAASGAPIDDVAEVSCYVAAMEHGLARLRDGFPLSARLIREIHEKLLSGNRGAEKSPGDFRRSQNWIGGTRPGNAAFVPPPPHQVEDHMSDLEKFLHRQDPSLPTLVKAGLAHVQFESIHPFLDGNGRLGRLLVTLLLCHDGALREPLLYLSLHLKANRSRYYQLLQQVRETGDWEAWLEFFLTGVKETAAEATETARRILVLFDQDRRRLETIGHSAASALRVHQRLQSSPILSTARAAKEVGLSIPTVARAFDHLQRLGIVNEITGRRRGRLFAYVAYLDAMTEGTAPLSR